MQVVAKLYTSLRSTTPYDQVFLESEVKIERDITVFGIATFDLPLIQWIQEDQKVELYEVSEIGNDIKVFSGFIFELEPYWDKFWQIKVTLRSEKALFYKRVALSLQKVYEVESEATNLPVRPNSFKKSYFIRNAWLTRWMVERYAWAWYDEGTWNSYYLRNTQWLSTVTYVFVKDTSNLYKLDTALSLVWWWLTWIPTNTFLTELFDDYNVAPYNENRTVDTDLSKEIRQDIERGDLRYDIMEDLAENNDAYWDVDWWVVKLYSRTNYGNDYTSGSWYQEVFFDGRQESISNISKISVKWIANRTNVIIHDVMRRNRDRSWSNKKQDMTDGIVYGAVYKKFKDWDTETTAQAFLDNNNVQKRSYSVEVENNSINAEVGDKLKLRVQNTNSFFNIDSDVFVTKKTIVYNKGKNTSYEFQTFNSVKYSQEERGRLVTKNIKLLQQDFID